MIKFNQNSSHVWIYGAKLGLVGRSLDLWGEVGLMGRSLD